MPITYKVLGQSTPTPNVLDRLYTAPGDGQGIISSITVCNNSELFARFRIRVTKSGTGQSYFVEYDAPLARNETLPVVYQIALDANDYVDATSTTGKVSFSAFGFEQRRVSGIKYKILGQKIPAVNNLENLYTVPGGLQGVAASIVVCNNSDRFAQFKIAVNSADGTTFIEYNDNLVANETIAYIYGVTLGSGDSIDVYATTDTVAFSAFGFEGASMWGGSGIDGGGSGGGGAAGPAGPPGATGATGPAGPPGNPGVTGPTGPQGPAGSGSSGFSGFSGYSGQDGAASSSGFSGYSGISGTSGYSGRSGYSGVGTSGYSGISGFSGFSGSSPAWLRKTGTWTAASGERIKASTAGGAWSLTFPPSPAEDDQIEILDIDGTFDTNNLTILTNGKKVMGFTTSWILDTQSFHEIFTYDTTNGDWRI